MQYSSYITHGVHNTGKRVSNDCNKALVRSITFLMAVFVQ